MSHPSLLRSVSRAALACAALLPPAALAAQDAPRRAPRVNAATTILPASPRDCALLDDRALRDQMDGLLYNLIWSCGREHEIAQPPEAESTGAAESLTEALLAVDVQVNNSAGESGNSTTQSETSLARNGSTGTLCSAFNDSYSYLAPGGGGGFTSFARSTDGGLSWQDRGSVGSTSMGDPSLVWRRKDGFFYLATLESGGALSFWRSNDDCQTFTKVGVPSTGGDDKEMLAVDNNPSSPYYGTIYLVWTDYGLSTIPVKAIRTTNGGTSWSAAVTLTTYTSATGVPLAAWPTVAPNGNVYVGWMRRPNTLKVEVVRSTNGGASFTAVASPLSNAVTPRDAAATTACSNRHALKGNIRYVPSPQLTVTSDGTLHVVYSYDPDGYNVGDVVNVYYRRSTDAGASWSTEVRLNDVTTNDQYYPTVQSDGLRVVAGWYDRRNDPDNVRQDYYKRVSTDAGLTWGANVRVTDVNSPIRLDPGLATCYHGDYDQSLVTGAGEVMQWSDDRNLVGTRNDPDVWSDVTVGTFREAPACSAASATASPADPSGAAPTSCQEGSAGDVLNRQP